MIPKIIHYCWFGEKPLSPLAKKCIESWKKYCPDYEIKLWNESNIDLESVPYMKEAYDRKVWGFVPDVARLQIIYNEGGFYFDTDVELIKTLDELLQNKAVMGFEDEKYVNLGSGFGAEKKNDVIKKLLDDYCGLHFLNSDGSENRTPSPMIQTKSLKEIGLSPNGKAQTVQGAVIYPSEYFCPISFVTGECTITSNTFSIHHFDGSWVNEEERAWTEKHKKIRNKYGKIFGEIIWAGIRFAEKWKKQGIKSALKAVMKRLKK